MLTYITNECMPLDKMLARVRKMHPEGCELVKKAYEFAENADVTPPTEMAVAPAKACFRKSFLVNIVLYGLVVFFCKVSKNMVAHSICHTF